MIVHRLLWIELAASLETGMPFISLLFISRNEFSYSLVRWSGSGLLQSAGGPFRFFQMLFP